MKLPQASESCSRSHNDLACFGVTNLVLVTRNLTIWSAASYSARVACYDRFVASPKPRFRKPGHGFNRAAECRCYGGRKSEICRGLNHFAMERVVQITIITQEKSLNRASARYFVIK